MSPGGGQRQHSLFVLVVPSAVEAVLTGRLAARVIRHGGSPDHAPAERERHCRDVRDRRRTTSSAALPTLKPGGGVAAVSPARYNRGAMREYHYRVDRDGRIFHDGSEITDPPTLRFFLLGMTRTADGRYLVPCQGEQNWFSPEDTPFVVQRLGLRSDAGRLVDIDLCLAGDYRERLDPATLEAADGRLCCRVRRGAFRATFGRVAMQQIAPYLSEDSGRATLVLGDHRYPIAEAAVIDRALAGPMPGRPRGPE